MEIPICPIHNEPLEKADITQGDTLLGWLWLCPQHEWGSKRGDCEYFLDADDEGNPILEEEERGV